MLLCSSDMKTKTLVSEDGLRTVYTYDDSGNQIRMTDYDLDARVTCDCFYQNNEAGDVIGWQVFNGAEEMLCRFEVDYDPQGLESEHREYGASGQLVRRELYFYDLEGRKIEERHYDGEGNLLREPAA